MAIYGHLNTVPTRAGLKEVFEGLETKTTFYCKLHEVVYPFARGFLPSSLFFGQFRGFLWFKHFQRGDLKMAALQGDAILHFDDQNNVEVRFIDEEYCLLPV